MAVNDRYRAYHRVGETKDYSIDWSDELDDDDYIVAVNYSVSDASLTKLSENVWEKVSTTSWVVGAVAARVYDVACMATTEAGRQFIRIFQIIGK